MNNSKKQILWRIVSFLLCCGVVIGLYMYLAGLNNYVLTYALMISYAVVFLALVFGYVIYNRGMVGKRISADMLAPELSREEREAIVSEIDKRRERSAWMIPVAVPFLLSFLLDYIGIQEIFDKLCNLF